ncbi:MAG TPA: TerB family tellurite resistance protein [Devosia sp.]|nr:TerB family tellurite resistance protein [Devosia sp.]
MFSAISRLFASPKEAKQVPVDPKLAVAALLVHLMGIDGEITDEENKTVSRVLKEHFDLSETQITELLEIACKKDAEAVDFYQFTSTITQLEMEQRIEIIAMMWSVVYADRENHELEDNMVWRVAELIGVSARDRTQLRAKIKRQNIP